MITVKEAINDFKEYMEKLKDGYSPGIITPFPLLNSQLMGGLPKNTVCCVAAHSGRGKTAFALQLLMNAPVLNPNCEVLFFTLEMPARSLIARTVSNKLKLTVKEIYNNKMDIDEDIFKEIENLPVFFSETGGTPETIYNTISNFCSTRGDKEVLVVLDHTLLVDGREDGEKIGKLSTIFNKLKLKHKNLTILVLSQLNDAMLDNSRLDRKGVLLFPQYKDLYFGRQMWMMCDSIMVINNPSEYIEEHKGNDVKKKNKEYGGLPLRDNKGRPLLYLHFVKGRDTGTGIISFYNGLKYSELREYKLETEPT